MNKLYYAESIQPIIDHDSGHDEPELIVLPEDYENAIDALADEDIDGMHDIVFELPFWREHFDKWVHTDKALRKDLCDRQLVIDRAADLAERRSERQRECDAVDAAFEDAA